MLSLSRELHEQEFFYLSGEGCPVALIEQSMLYLSRELHEQEFFYLSGEGCPVALMMSFLTSWPSSDMPLE
jgi:hypothetical protein